MRKLMKQLARNEDAVSSILVAASLPAVLGASALAVDVGSIFLAKRELQGVADAAAAASVGYTSDLASQNAVTQVINDSGLDRVAILEATDGEYRRSKEIAPEDRFVPSSTFNNAARVVLKRDVPLFFGRFLTGQEFSGVTASAVASRTDMAGFMLGTRIVSINTGLASNVLSALAGRNLGLSGLDINRLANEQIDVVRLAEMLGRVTSMEGSSFGEIFEEDTSLRFAVEAMAMASNNSETRNLLLRVSANVDPNRSFTPEDLIDLGPLKNTNVNDGTVGARVDAFSLLRTFLQASHGETYEITLNTSVAGLAGVNLRLAGGYSDERSPWLTMQTVQEVTLRTAETRVLVNARTNPLSGLPLGLNVPFYTDLASAEAQMTSIVCATNDMRGGVSVAAKPSIGTMAIAGVNLDKFDDFSSPLELNRAQLLRTVLVDVTAIARVDVGGLKTTTLHFTPEEIKRLQTKSVSTTDPVSGIASSLVRNVDLDVNALGLGVNLSGVTSLVGSTLTLVSPAVDQVFADLTKILGVGLGNADVTVDRLRCGQPTIVG